MKARSAISASVLVLSTALSVGSAIAQVPPHTPGTICFTQSFWCWAQPPGPAGGACYCNTPNGWVPGRLG